MPRRAITAFVLTLCSLMCTLPAAAVEPAITVRKFVIDISVDAEGRATTLVHREQSASSLATAAQIGQMPIDFNPSLERVEILHAYTQKRDGTRKEADASAIRAQLAPGVPNVPIFQDVQQKVVVFPDLQAGDTQVIDYRRETKQPLFPGQFFLAREYSSTI